VKVDDADRLPHAEIVAAGSHPESTTKGYLNYPFPGGINMIFSDVVEVTDSLMPPP
jgi:hypothetical protein